MAFLGQWCPEGPWILTAIAHDRDGIETRTFAAAQVADMAEWIESQNGQQRNVYFHVNPAMRPLSKKAEREDIAALSWLHVDIDPRAGEDIDQERQRALNLLQSPPGDVPLPTCIVFSGGGYQGFWRLDAPLPVDGELDKAEDVKRYNIQLEVTFGADACHNIDRIMRLPGTVNWPSKKKRAKGRRPILAKLVEFHPERVYPISRFTPAQAVQSGDAGFAGHQVKVSGNVKRLRDVHELDDLVPDKDHLVPDWCKVLIVQGIDPDNPTKYPSRSETLFAVCCELVRRGCDDDTIYSVITDPDFRISESVLNKGSSAERYAVRQIERARENAINPALRELNERHAVISSLGGRCRVIEEVWDHAMRRGRMVRQSFEDFRNRYMHRTVKVGETKEGAPVVKKLGHWWLEHEMRRQYDAVIFAPGSDAPGVYNLWRGFACEAKPGDCSLFLSHLHHNLCAGDEEHYRYLLGWMARCIQHPDKQGETAVVLRGRMGTGKSFFAKAFGSLLGRHYLQVTDPKHLVGNFNAHLRDCVVIFADEAFYAGDKKHESILKGLITEESIIVEPKGVDAEAVPNYLHLIMASDQNWVVPAGVDDRRFFVLDVGHIHIRDTGYFKAIQDQLDNGGREALLHYLLTHDLSDFDVRRIPKTKALQEQKLLSLTPEQEWWFRKLEDGRLMSEHSKWLDSAPKEDILNDYLTYSQRVGVNRRATGTALGRFLKRACPDGWPRSQQRLVDRPVEDIHGHTRYVKARPYYYEFPPLHECRKHWDEFYGGPYDWPAVPDRTQTDMEEEPF
jgi:hypothetical protein